MTDSNLQMKFKSTKLQIIRKRDKVVEKELSYQLGGIFFEIQDELGRFCRERQYGDVFEKKLLERKISFIREFSIEVGDRKSNFVDFIIDDRILIDFKAKPYFEKNDYYQMKRYLHTSGKTLGLLVNFRDRYLRPKRILNSEKVEDSKFVDSNTFVGSNRRAFTLVEFMVVISLAVILTGSIAFYGRTAERQVLIYRDQVKVVSLLQKARALSLSAFAEGGTRACGFGVLVKTLSSPHELILFSNPPNDVDDPACSGNVRHDYDTSAGLPSVDVEVLELDPRVQFRTSGTCMTDLTQVFYIPPDPSVVINDNDLIQKSTIVLETVVASDASTRTVVVTKGGQITAGPACP